MYSMTGRAGQNVEPEPASDRLGRTGTGTGAIAIAIATETKPDMA